MQKDVSKTTTDTNTHDVVFNRLNSYVISVMDLPDLKETHVKLLTVVSHHNKKISGIQKRFDELKAETVSIKEVLAGLCDNEEPSHTTDKEQEKLRSKQSQLISLFQEKSEWVELKQDAENMINSIRSRIGSIQSDNQMLREGLELKRLAQGSVLIPATKVSPEHIKEVA